MTSLDGEYILLGRKIGDISNIFVQFGQGATRTVNVTGGEGKQEAEFIDGLRLSIESNQSFTLNADIKDGVDQNTLPAETKSLSKCLRVVVRRNLLTRSDSYAWVVNTTIPDSGVKAAELRVPCKFKVSPRPCLFKVLMGSDRDSQPNDAGGHAARRIIADRPAQSRQKTSQRSRWQIPAAECRSTTSARTDRRPHQGARSDPAGWRICRSRVESVIFMPTSKAAMTKTGDQAHGKSRIPFHTCT